MSKKRQMQQIANGDILTHSWFRRQYKLILLIAGLIFIYIFMDFQAQRQQHHLTTLQKELQETQFEHLTIEAELTKKTRQSAIKEELQARGSELQENVRPVMYISNEK
ncbi:MAG: hypothetical protein MJZ55_03250 [Paludibacteraceae bacterium]|nr:hypothetical protein [Paludibacteraceae bacterium]